jgi:hypothetical protein
LFRILTAAAVFSAVLILCIFSDEKARFRAGGRKIYPSAVEKRQMPPRQGICPPHKDSSGMTCGSENGAESRIFAGLRGLIHGNIRKKRRIVVHF